MRLSALTAIAISTIAVAGSGSLGARAPLIVTPPDIVWKPAPSPWPAAVKVAVLEGDPDHNGSNYVMRQFMPRGTIFPVHYHEQDEHVAVLSGTFMLGIGSTGGWNRTRPLPAGSYFMVPAHVRHFGWARTDTVVEFHGIGPRTMTFVKPRRDMWKYW